MIKFISWTTNELSSETLHYISLLNYADNLFYIMCLVWLSESQRKSHLSYHGTKRAWFVSNVTTRISMLSTVTRLPGMLQSLVCEWHHNQVFQLVATQPDERQAVLQYDYYINPLHDVSLLCPLNLPAFGLQRIKCVMSAVDVIHFTAVLGMLIRIHFWIVWNLLTCLDNCWVFYDPVKYWGLPSLNKQRYTGEWHYPS